MTQKQYAKLRGRIVEKFGSCSKFAKHIEMNRSSLATKLNSVKGFSKKEIITFCEALDIDKSDIGDYFFN